MDHTEATAANAVDRYLLGELSAAEADAFEEHYFDCAECADELRVGMRFMNGGRGMAREEAAPEEAKVVRIDERRSRRTAWLPVAVAAALILAVGTPLLMRQQQPASAPYFGVPNRVSLLQTGMRDGVADIVIQANEPTELVFDVPPEPEYPRYEARIHRPDGSVLTTAFKPDLESDSSTELTVDGLTAGSHELEIVGIDAAGRATEIAPRTRVIVRR